MNVQNAKTNFSSLLDRVVAGETIPLSEEEAISAEKLAILHQDPFDRMIIAQALVQGKRQANPS